MPADLPPVYFDARDEFAARFLFGTGLEIGALHLPLAIPAHARVRYVDRMTVDELRREYSELADWDLTPVDLVDDGEFLSTIPDASQDFIVANHFLEHCEDPIGTIGVHLRKLKPGGILFYAVPDKRFTFDFLRPPTPLEHMVADHERGPERSRRGHYEEWARLVADEQSTQLAPEQSHSEKWLEQRAGELESAKYSIHMHVWTQAEFLKLILHCRERFGEAFEIEAAARRSLEFLVVLRKQGALPDPPSTLAVVSEQGMSLDPKTTDNSSSPPGEELEQREEILRLRDLLIGKDAELVATKEHVAELEGQLRRYTRIADHLRHPWRLFHVVFKRLRARRNPRD